MSDQSKLGLGKIITTDQEKDAIHIAVAPMIAGEALSPGAHVGLLQDGRVARNTTHVGVVDPFLKKGVKPGERFWLYLYPGSITSLKHTWAHPAFEGKELPVVSLSEQWIRNYCGSLGVGYDEMMHAAENYAKHGEYWCQGDRFEGWSLDPEFWEHYEKVTGVKVEGKWGFFSCSC